MCWGVALITLGLVSPAPTIAYTISASAFVSQFATPDSESFTGSDEIVPVLPTVSASQVGPNGVPTTSASASPTTLTASFSTANTSVNVPGASASYDEIGIVFQNNQALRDLIGPTGTSFDLLLNFDIDYNLETALVPGPFRQALSFLSINFVAVSLGDFSASNGRASITNGPFDHTFENSGFLAGLPENGGSTTTTLPIKISPFGVGEEGLYVSFLANASVSGLSLDEVASGEVTVSIPDLPFFVTTPDGTSASDLGIEFDLIPRVESSPPPPSVLEPTSTLGILTVGALGGSSMLKRKQRQQQSG